jgi:RecA/RadA recombinase
MFFLVPISSACLDKNIFKISDECYKLIARISQICTPKPKTAQVLYLQQKNQCIPLDVIGIDQCLRGGVRIGTLTEIVGRAGIGKTQMVMQLCVVAARLGYGSIFVDTERKLSLQRLYEIARERAKSSHGRVPSNMIGSSSTNMNSGQDGFDYSGVVENDVGQSDHFATDGSNSNHDYKSPLQVMNNITVHTPASTEELLAVVSRLDEEIIVRSHASSTTITPTSNGQQIQALPVKLIILDSIAAPTRKDFGGGSATERAAAIFQLAQTLKRVADEMQVAIVVINQIDTAYSGEVDQTFDNDVSCVKAALGISWYHCVSTRIALEHKLNRSQTGMRDLHPSLGISSSIRTATIVKSNLVGKQQALFEVTTKGVCHVDG